MSVHKKGGRRRHEEKTIPTFPCVFPGCYEEHTKRQSLKVGNGRMGKCHLEAMDPKLRAANEARLRAGLEVLPS